MSTKKLRAKSPRLSKAFPVNLRRDVAALTKLVTTTVQQIKIGKPMLMVVSVVNLRGLPLASVMIKGPPPPPLLDLKALLGFVADGARRINAGESLVMVATAVDMRTNGFTALMAKGPLPSPETAMLIRGAPPPPP